jgi:hypothetical protein
MTEEASHAAHGGSALCCNRRVAVAGVAELTVGAAGETSRPTPRR